MKQTEKHMHTHSEARNQDRTGRRPLYGSVWLALFLMLRDGANPPRSGTSDAALNRGGSPSRRL